MTEVTAQQLLERSLRHFGPRTAVIDGERRLSYAALAERTARLANVLIAAGAGPEAPVATWMPNRLEFIEVDVACTRAGLLRVGIGDRLSADEVAYILERSGARVLVLDPLLEPQLSPELLGELSLVLRLGLAARDAPTAEYDVAIVEASPHLTAIACTTATPNYLLYTSGTTGRPKGATHTHGSRARSTLNMLASELRRFDRDTVFAHSAPMTHGSGSKILPVLLTGGANLVLPRFRPESFAAAVAAEHATHTFMVPTMLQRLLEADPGAVRAARGLRQITFGGAPISPKLFARAVEQIGPRLTQIYGTSELPHPLTVLHPEDYTDPAAFTSAGRAAHGVELGGGSGADETGSFELLVRAPHAMAGYWRDAEATAAVFDADGWYHTGDVVRIAENGLVTFMDRARELIVSGGLNVYPSEVERVLLSHPAVRSAAVVGAPSEEWGETVVAYVVVAPGAATDDAALRTHVRERLAGYKQPRRVVFVEELPLSSNGKVLKRVLRERLWEGHERRVG